VGAIRSATERLVSGRKNDPVGVGVREAPFQILFTYSTSAWTSTEAKRVLRESEISSEKRAKAGRPQAAVVSLQSWNGDTRSLKGEATEAAGN